MTQTYKEVSATDPGQANEAKRLADLAFASPPDPVTVLPDTLGTLPRGWIDPDGELQTEYEVRELTGASEERLGKIFAKQATNAENLPQLYQAILEEGLVAIGEHKPNAAMLRNLLLGDRDFLLLKIRIATYGPDYEARIRCPRCDQYQDVVFELNEGQDVPYVPAPPGAEKAFHDVKLRNGRTARIRQVNAQDQAIALKDPTLTPAERNTLIFSRIVQDIDGDPIVTIEVMKAMSAGDRRILSKFLNDNEFGPNLQEVKAECAHCKQTSDMSLSLASMFL